MIKPLDAANWFIKNMSDHAAGEVVTHLQVQKLLYFAQAWHMMMLDKPLFGEDMQAWPHGPVVPSVWHQFKEHEWRPIPPDQEPVEIPGESLDVLEQVREIYGSFSAKKLEAITHAERPWIDARGTLPPEARCDGIVTKESILEFYKATYGDV